MDLSTNFTNYIEAFDFLSIQNFDGDFVTCNLVFIIGIEEERKKNIRTSHSVCTDFDFTKSADAQGLAQNIMANFYCNGKQQIENRTKYVAIGHLPSGCWDPAATEVGVAITIEGAA